MKIAGLGAVVAGTAALAVVAPSASAHACNSTFFSTHGSVETTLLSHTSYGTRTTLQELFRLPSTLRAYRSLTIVNATALRPGTGPSRMIRIFLRSAATGYLNSLAYPAWIGPDVENLKTNVHHVLMSQNTNVIRSYGAQLAVANNEVPCTLAT